MYILNIASTIKKISVTESRDFIFEIYYKRVRFSRENRHYLQKRLKTKIFCCLQLD